MKTGSANFHFLCNFSQLPLSNIRSFTDYSFRDLCGCRHSYIIFADPVFKKTSINTVVVTIRSTHSYPRVVGSIARTTGGTNLAVQGESK